MATTREESVTAQPTSVDDDGTNVDKVEERERVRELAEEAFEDLRSMGVEVAPSDQEVEDSGGFTLAELERLAKNLEIIRQLGADDPMIRGQWSRQNGNYTLIGETAEILPPGYYDTTVDQVGNIWFNPIRARGERLLRFPDAATDKIISEIETFWERQDVFEKFGLPFKRGILLYGPPGSGKTCTLQLLARDVVARDGIVLIYQPEIFVHAYRQLRRLQPETPVVVLMEDIDAVLDRHNESVVLNTLDGTDTIHKTVFVATTNYPEKLGERIINRPSRFDRRLFIPDPSEVARRMYLEDMIGDRELPEGASIDAMVRDTKGMSLAHVKELFVATVVIGSPYVEALKNLKEMHLEVPTSLRDRDKYGTYAQQSGQYV